MTYPGVLVYCAAEGCGHLEQVHHYSRRGDRSVRTKCSHQDEAGYCPCQLFVQPVLYQPQPCPTCGHVTAVTT